MRAHRGRRAGGAALGIALGVLADRTLGDPARGHPVAGFGSMAGRLERVVWRPRRRAGVVYALGLVGACALSVRAVERRVERSAGARVALGALVTWAALGGRSLEREATRLGHLVAAGALEDARSRLPTLVGRDPTGLPASELCRATIESVAENTADAVVGPLVWGALAGPGAAAAYRAANTLDAMVGHRGARYERFGWASARMDDLATWPAARLAALLAVVLAPVAGGERHNALKVLRRDRGAHPSPNAGLLEAAFAGVLGVRLGGLNRYASGAEARPTLGDGRSPGPVDVHRAVRLSRAVGEASAALTVALAAVRAR
jgi:adenosylcobinamide-phosphate synthase